MAIGKRTTELEMRSILVWSLEGLSNLEISQRLGIHRESVARIKTKPPYQQICLHASRLVQEIPVETILGITKQ